jgi:hypothetical protein
MRFTAKRLIGAGVIGVAAIVAPISLTVGLPILNSGTATVASAAAASCTPVNAAFDTICYIQAPNGIPDTYQYVPATGQPPAPQTVTVSGNCATATPGDAILNMCGFVYSSNTYAGASKAANLGTNGTATGVGAVSPSWTLDNKLSGQKQQAEAIDFSAGGSTTVANNRPFNDAQIQIQRKDTGVAQNPAVTVQLVEFDSSGKLLATQNCTINGNTGTQITADTNGSGIGGNCLGSQAPAFQTVEVRDLTVSTSISVVNTSTFTLQNELCGGPGNTIGSNGLPPNQAVASITLNAAPNVCKPFSAFTSTTTGSTTNVEFDASALGEDLSWTIVVNWPEQSFCTPDGSPPGPVCAPTTVSFSDPVTGTVVNGQDQTYCAAATAQNQLCTVSKQFNYNVPPINGAPGVQITETWSGDLDWGLKH